MQMTLKYIAKFILNYKQIQRAKQVFQTNKQNSPLGKGNPTKLSNAGLEDGERRSSVPSSRAKATTSRDHKLARKFITGTRNKIETTKLVHDICHIPHNGGDDICHLSHCGGHDICHFSHCGGHDISHFPTLPVMATGSRLAFVLWVGGGGGMQISTFVCFCVPTF